MARERINKDRILTARERQERFQGYHIDNDLDKAFANINWDRRKKCEADITLWVETYCVGLLLEDAPSERGNEVIRRMFTALDSHQYFNILMGRGSGKSSLGICVLIASLALAKQKFLAIISSNARDSANIIKDIWRFIIEPDSNFANDYPEVSAPYIIAAGAFKRKQMYKGLSTEITKSSGEIVFPRLKDETGKEYPTSGSLIIARGISGSLRGTSRRGTKRISAVLLDDIQTTETAESPEQVKKLLDTIKKDIIPLAGKQKLSIINCATRIAEDDLIDELIKDKSWNTLIYPAIISYPNNKDLWKEYFRLYDKEVLVDNSHNESTNFYRDNKAKMDEGAEVFNPDRFDKKEHLSALQKLLITEHEIGHKNFKAEYQQEIIKSEFVVNVSPKKMNEKQNSFKKLEVPSEYRYITFGIDINPSYAISVSGMAWKPDTTGIVIYHQKFRLHIDQKLPDTQYNTRLYNELEKVCNKIKSFNLNIDGVAIDCGGKQWDGVNLFTRNYKGLPVCAFAGRSSSQFINYAFSRGRLKDALGKSVLMGNQDEHNKAGSGFKYVFFDADFCKESIQVGFNCVVGDVGSISLYNAGNNESEHLDFVIECSNERIKSKIQKQDGRTFYTWQSKEPHDYLDTLSMCRAVLFQLGISSSIVNADSQTSNTNKHTQKPLKMKKPNKRFVII